MAEESKPRGKRLWAMTVRELAAEAERYERAGNEMWARLCRDQIDINLRIYDSFLRSCSDG